MPVLGVSSLTLRPLAFVAGGRFLCVCNVHRPRREFARYNGRVRCRPSLVSKGDYQGEKMVEEISPKSSSISILAPKGGLKEITPEQPPLPLGIEKDADVGGIGMGVLSDGTPYLNQRG